MNKNKLILTIVIALGLIGAIAYFSSSNTPSETTNEAINNETAMEDETLMEENKGMTATNLLDLVKQGENMQCTWEGSEEGTTFTGKTYIANNKFAGTTSITTEAETTESNMIGDGEMIYIWTTLEGQTFGYKMNYANLQDDLEVETQPDSMEAPKQNNVNQYFKDYNFDCNSWNVDESVFTVPSNIEFVDQTAMMESMMENLKDYMPQQ